MAETRSCVLVVDDDVELAREITDYLERYEFRAVAASRWDEALAAIEHERPAAIILDQWLGPVDTLPRLPELRRLSEAPVLILTANREETDRILGLEMGADDFLSKPVSGRELVARIRAQLRRSRPAQDRQDGPWTIDRAAQRLARAGGQSIRLTTAEFDALCVLAEAPGQVHSRDALSLAVFHRPWQPGDRAVDAIVANLRAKLDGWQHQHGADAPSCITTVRPIGYKFVKFPG
jgi:DNA-binding response OmpR family regulator